MEGRTGSRKGWALAAGALAAGLAGLAYAWVTAAREDAALWLETRPTRSFEVRLSSAPARRHRPLELERGGSTTEPPPLEALARLQSRGDAVAVADAYLLRDQPEAARPFAERADPTPDGLSTRAALELMVGRPEEALRHASAALVQEPKHGPARWNRALALRGLGLTVTATQELEAVAGQGEPGWSEEAKAAAAALKVETERRRGGAVQGMARCRAAIERGEPFTLELADVSARLTRQCFHEAVRAAATPERLGALEKAARELDERWGRTANGAENGGGASAMDEEAPAPGSAAGEAARAPGSAAGEAARAPGSAAGGGSRAPGGAAGKAARAPGPSGAARTPNERRDTAAGPLTATVVAARATLAPARVELSRQYAQALLHPASPEAWLALADAAARAKQPDVELGALSNLSAGRLDAPRLLRLAQASPDPWLAVYAQERAAQVDRAHGEPVSALERLAPIESRCERTLRPEDRCALVERGIAYSYILQHQTSRARDAGLRAFEWARRDGDWDQELQLLKELGQTFRVRGDLPLTRAYLDEALARSPADCEVQDYVRSNLALAHQRALDVPEVRRQVDLVSGCQPPSFSRMFAIADLQRSSPSPADLPSLEKGAAVLRASTAFSAGDQAIVTHLLGRAWLEHDHAKGEALLRQSLAEADRASATGETDRGADKARLYSYTSLLLDAGKRGDLRGALALFAEERRWAAPPPCSLWLTSDDERLLALAVDRSGHVDGRYDGARRKPIAPDEALVPAELLAPLRACEAVQVIARPPLEGRPNLLPPELAWSEVVRRGAAPAAAPGQRVVIAAPLPPASLRLPLLRSAPPPSPGALRLEGAAATPARVLEALRGASLVEIHAHGLIDPDVADASFLALTADPSGKFAFTASDLRGQALAKHPLVLLAACHAAETAPFIEEGYGLPEAFVAAGARAVLAATAPLPDAQSEPFFRPLLDRVQSGVPPAVALRDARVAWRATHGPSWADSVLLFE